MKKSYLLFFIVSLLLIFSSFSLNGLAKEYHINLLAVSESDGGDLRGSVADMYLEIVPGSGRIFIDTFPISKIDTQFSTRFANQIACQYVDVDCTDYDFIYTISANSPIVGGPSGSGAATVLTVAALTDSKIDEDIVMTGTINSGGVIGVVGGVEEKVKAAQREGKKLALVPFGFDLGINETSFENLSAEVDIEVIEVSNIEQVLTLMTDYKVDKVRNYSVNSDYKALMKTIASDLCGRSNDYLDKLSFLNDSFEYKLGLNLSNRSIGAIVDERYYSAASFCFGSNVDFAQLEAKNNGDFESLATSFESSWTEYSLFVDARVKDSITDVETYVLVKERLDESYELFESAVELNLKNETNASLNVIAYANERLVSAKFWARYFDQEYNSYVVDEGALKRSCVVMLSEAQEKYQYLNLFFQGLLNESSGDIDTAREHYLGGDYEFCIFSAGKAKSQMNVVMGLMSAQDDYVDILLDLKIDAAQRLFERQKEKGFFSIIGNSYFEYGVSLKDTQKVSALLYLEYALEFSNLDLYFEITKNKKDMFLDEVSLFWLLIGFIVGVTFVLIVIIMSKIFGREKPEKQFKVYDGFEAVRHFAVHKPKVKKKVVKSKVSVKNVGKSKNVVKKKKVLRGEF